MNTLHIARQPLFDRDLKLYGFELLNDSQYHHETPDIYSQRVSQLMLSSVIDLGIDKIAGDQPVFIELSPEFLSGNLEIPLQPGNTFLEIPGQLASHHIEQISARNLTDQGYKLVLENYQHNSNLHSLLEYTQYASINIDQYSDHKNNADLIKIISELTQHDIQVIARNINYQDQIELLRDMGFSFFQGNFLCRPQLTTASCMPTNRQAVLHLLSAIHHPEITIEELADIISTDVGLSYRVLKLVNSAAYMITRTIDSIHQAIVYLGTDAIISLATIISISGISDRPDELMSMALVRAKMCELLSHLSDDSDRANIYFTAGLLSITDAMLNHPIDLIIKDLPVNDEIKNAIIKNEGNIGHALFTVRAYEECRLKDISFNNIPAHELNQCFVKAIAWSNTIYNQLT